MAFIERVFFRKLRGPAPTDEDVWRLVYDDEARQVFIRHEWQARGNKGVEAYDIDEFLEEEGAAQDALIDALFPVHARA